MKYLRNKSIKEYSETHQRGTISLENVILCPFGMSNVEHPHIKGDF